MRVTSGLGLTVLAALASGACDACTKHKPYVPFAIEAGAHALAPEAEHDAGPPENTAIPVVDAGHLELPTSTLVVGGVTFQAPEGRLLTDVVSKRDAQGGTLLAIARDAAGQKPDELLAYAYDVRNSGLPAKVVEGPPIASDERCVQDAQIRFAGRSSAIAAWRIRCPSEVASEPASILAVAALGGPPALRLRVSYRDPVLDLPLVVDADAADMDDDGQDDLTLSVRIDARSPFTRASMPLTYKWLARTAGSSPLPGAFADAWKGLTRDLVTRVGDRDPGVFDALAAARTLVDGLCGPAPTLRVEAGGRLDPCDGKALGAALDTLERKALVARSDALLSAAYLASTEVTSPERTLLERGLAKTLPERTPRELRRDDPPVEGDAAADAGGLPVDPAGVADAFVPADSGAAPPAKLTLRAVEDRCTGALSAHVERGGVAFDVVLPLRSERRRGEGSGCAIEALPERSYRVVAATERGLVLTLRGRFVAVEVPLPAVADAGATPDLPSARTIFPATEGVAKLFADGPFALRVGANLVVAQKIVERFALPKDADPSVAELWPPDACAETTIPRVLRCTHAGGALLVTLPPQGRGTRDAGKPGSNAAPARR